ncbi:MAG: thiolase family protein [Deltaproteobacteria bacterium]|nr:thiolase family protein [Deltaproteobacteria bacterium]
MPELKEAVIVSAKRSPMGRANKGNYINMRIDDLGAAVVKAAVDAVPGLDPKEIEDVIVGCAMPEGEQGMNVARNISLLAGIPITAAAVTVNRFCASSLQTIMDAARAIMVGDGEVFVAAGIETMSHVPMGGFNPSLNPLLVPGGSPKSDQYPDAYIGMGFTAENVVAKYGIKREDMDAFAAKSHEKALKAIAENKFKNEIVPVNVPQLDGSTKLIDTDEGPRAGTTVEKLGTLKPAFKKDGSVTAGNSSPLTDGAAAVVVMSAEKAKALGLKPLARIHAMAVAGCAPELMGMGPVPAVTKVLKRAGMSIGDIDIVELNEAFASQSLAVVQELGIDQNKLNPHGGAIALGHPLGCSGARIMATLINDLITYDKKWGLETMCIGGGQGAACIIERL